MPSGEDVANGRGCLCVCTQSYLTLATSWPVALQAPLSMVLSRQECWSGLPCTPPGDLPDPGIEPTSLVSPALTDGFFTTASPGKPTSIWRQGSKREISVISAQYCSEHKTALKSKIY